MPFRFTQVCTCGQDFLGSWTNKSDGSVLSLRQGGRAIADVPFFGPPGITKLLRWVTNSQGIVLSELGDGKLPLLKLTYDPDRNMLVGSKNNDKPVFTRIPSEELHDTETDEERRWRERARQDDSVETTSQQFQSRNQLMTALVSLLRIVCEERTGKHNIVVTNRSFAFSMEGDSHGISLTLPLLAKLSGRTNRFRLGSVPVDPANAPPDLPTIYSLKESDIAKMTAFLAAEKVTVKTDAAEVWSHWDVEGYQKAMSITCDPAVNRITNIVNFVVFALFGEDSAPFDMKHSKQKK